MSNQIWIAVTVIALLAGLALGVWAGGRAARQALVGKLRGFDKELADQRARTAQEVAAAQTQAAREVEHARLQGQRLLDAARAEHRTETEKLALHLTEACDALDTLRVQLAAAGPADAPDTGQGFAATLPMNHP